jgi:hypothetical protein
MVRSAAHCEKTECSKGVVVSKGREERSGRETCSESIDCFFVFFFFFFVMVMLSTALVLLLDEGEGLDMFVLCSLV